MLRRESIEACTNACLRALVALIAAFVMFAASTRADRLHLTDGRVIEADEVWESAGDVWYRRGGMTRSIARSRVSRVERDQPSAVSSKTESATPAQSSATYVQSSAKSAAPSSDSEVVARADVKPSGEGARAQDEMSADASVVKSAGASVVEVAAPVEASAKEPPRRVLIHLVGGASFEVDEIAEAAGGVVYKREKLQNFIEGERISRIETVTGDEGFAHTSLRRAPAWTTGSRSLDSLIRSNGARYSVDPYLIFLVMEHESHFNPRAVSHAGARGLMQLMPGTAARFGVRNIHDPAENVRGGTRYLKELLRIFDGRIDLVLAGYNAGEGAVIKYGRRVPPYRETRNYVRRIRSRYGRERDKVKLTARSGEPAAEP